MWGRANEVTDRFTPGWVAEGLSRGSTVEQTSLSVPLDKIRVTSVRNFWQTVKGTVETGTLLASLKAEGTHPEKNHTDTDIKRMRLATSLAGCVILLPRIVPQVDLPNVA